MSKALPGSASCRLWSPFRLPHWSLHSHCCKLLTSAVSSLQVLVEELPLLLASMNFKRSMRWRGSTAYSRPLRWLMALHGSTALPFTYAGMTATDVTLLLRNSQDPICQVSSITIAASHKTLLSDVESNIEGSGKALHDCCICLSALFYIFYAQLSVEDPAEHGSVPANVC